MLTKIKFGMFCFLPAVFFVTDSAIAFPVYGYGSANGSQLSALESSVTHQLGSVEKTLESTHKELTDARKQFAKAESAYRQQSHEYQLLHQQVQKEADSQPALVAARKRLAESERAFHDERERVLKQLKTNTDYQTVLDQKQAASSQLSGIESRESRASLAKQIADFSATLSSRETDAIAADHDANQARTNHLEAEQELAALVRGRNNAVANDSRLSSSKLAFNRAHSDFDGAKRQLTQTQATATHAERAYQSLMQEKIMLDQQRAQQRVSHYGSGRGFGRSSRLQFGPGPLGGALRIVPPPTVIIH